MAPNVAAGEPAHAEAAPKVSDVGVEYSRRADGLQRLTFIDMRTGVVISETPPPQVLAVVDHIVDAIRARES
ncbi:MAG TPA: hypothetical protein VHL53_20940 [Acidimicrobiia bacterium]|nr:hypothetical protein [Acidimicrobiia bacterium]